MRIILIILSFALIWPAMAIGQQSSDVVSEQEEYATLYFYRKPEFYSGRFDCWIGETRLIKNFQRSSYFWLNLPAGTYEIKTNGRPAWTIYEKKYELKVEAGQVYYIEAVLDYDFLGTALLLQVRSQADFDLLKSKLSFDERAIRVLD